MATNKSKKQARLYFDPLARSMTSVSNTVGGAAESANNAAVNIRKDTAAWFHKFEPYLDDIDNAVDSVVGAGGFIDDVTDSVDRGFDRILSTVRKSLSGWSSHSGQVVMALNGIAANPLDFNSVGNNVKSLLNGLSPGLGDSLSNNMQTLNLDKIAKAPEMIFGSIEHLARAIDNILAVPLAFISTIYFGVIEIMKKIGKAINEMINSLFDFLFEFLDELLPLTEILTLLETIGTLANQIQGIASIFGGVNIVSGFALQISTFTNQINSALTNPFDTVLGYLPNDISQGYSQIMYNLQNPQNFINQFIPKELTGMLADISKVTGYGFNGNMGYGIESILKASQEGLVTGFLNDLKSQYSVLGPLIGGTAMKQTPEQVGSNPYLTNGYNNGLNNRKYSGRPQWVS
jgi:hypothetical protein